MDSSAQRRWMILAVLAAFAALFYIAWRPRPDPLVPAPAPATLRPTSVAAALTAPAAARATSAPPAPQATARPNAPAAGATAAPFGAELFGPPELTSMSGPDDWAMEGYNPARTRAIDQPLRLPLAQRHEMRLSDDVGTGSPLTIARGTMLVESEHRLRAIDLATGAQRWDLPMVGVYISPAIAGNIVFIRSEANNEGQMLALDVNTGKQLWAFTPQRLSSAENSYFGGHLTSPVVVEGTVFVGAGKEVYALQANSGAVRWTFAAKDYISSSATVADGRVYISDFRNIYALDQQSGTMLWSRPTTMSIYFAPVAAGSSVLLADGESLVALEAATGKQLWTKNIPGRVLIPGAVSDSRVFVKSISTLYALDLASGTDLWQFDALNFVSLPAVASDQVFIISGSGADSAIVALDAASGQSSWKQTVAALATAAPVIAGQTIYVRTGDGRVLGFQH
jgi:outer membrane protein assembly factor BamB